MDRTCCRGQLLIGIPEWSRVYTYPGIDGCDCCHRQCWVHRGACTEDGNSGSHLGDSHLIATVFYVPAALVRPKGVCRTQGEAETHISDGVANNRMIAIVTTTIFDMTALDGYADSIIKSGREGSVRFYIIPDCKTATALQSRVEGARRRGLDVVYPNISEQDEFLERLGMGGDSFPTTAITEETSDT